MQCCCQLQFQTELIHAHSLSLAVFCTAYVHYIAITRICIPSIFQILFTLNVRECEGVKRIAGACPLLRLSSSKILCMQISDKIHIFDHSWIIAPGLTVSSVSTPDPSQPPPSFNSMRNTEPLHFMRDPHALVSDDTPIHIVSDSPLTLTKGAFVGCTEDVGDPWFRLNHEVDQRAGSAGRAKLLRTVASGGAMHVFYDAVPDTGVCGNGTESTFQKVHWHAAPAVQRFCPASRR